MKIIQLILAAFSFASTISLAGPAGLPQAWTSAGIGTRHKGSAKIVNDAITVKASGNDIWRTGDSFQYVSTVTNGDVTLIARIKSLDRLNEWTRAGLMIRAGDDANARFIGVYATSDHGIVVHWRSKENAEAVSDGVTTDHVVPNAWIKLVKTDTQVVAFASSDGWTWTQHGAAINMKLPDRFYVGLAVTARKDGAYTTARFDNLSPMPSKIAEAKAETKSHTRP